MRNDLHTNVQKDKKRLSMVSQDDWLYKIPFIFMEIKQIKVNQLISNQKIYDIFLNKRAQI